MKNRLQSRRFYIGVFIATLLLIIGTVVLRKNIHQVSDFGYIGLILLNFISSATILFPLPGVATVFIGGALLNPILVGLSSGIGAALGELSGYLLGFSGRGVIDNTLTKNKYFSKINYLFVKGGFVTIILMALIPSPFFDFVGIMAGTVQYPIVKYVIATFIGRSMRNFLIAWAGAKILPL